MSKKVLVVDDNRGVCHALSSFLSASGYIVDTSMEFVEARRLLQSGEYDALVSDLRLEGTADEAGLALLQTARQHSPRTRCVLLSAYLNESVEAAARESGAVAILRKPIPLAVLFESLGLDPQNSADTVPSSPVLGEGGGRKASRPSAPPASPSNQAAARSPVRFAAIAVVASLLLISVLSVVRSPGSVQSKPERVEFAALQNPQSSAFPAQTARGLAIWLSLAGASGFFGLWLHRRNEANLRARVAMIAECSQRAFRLPDASGIDPTGAPRDPRHIDILHIGSQLPEDGALRNVVRTMPVVSLHSHQTASGAVSEAQRLKPSMIFLQLDLPDGSAESVLAGIRADTSLRRVQVIVAGGDAIPAVVARFQKLGADVCIAAGDQDSIREQIERMAVLKFLAAKTA